MRILYLIIGITFIVGISAIAVTNIIFLQQDDNIKNTNSENDFIENESQDDNTSENQTSENNNWENLVTLYELTLYPYKYQNKTVTLRHSYMGNKDNLEWKHWLKGGGRTILYMKIKNINSCPELICDAEYYFTGTFIFTNNYSFLSYYLDDTIVSSIEIISEKTIYSRSEIMTYSYQLLDKKITTYDVYSDSSYYFTGFYTDYEDFDFIKGAAYIFTGYLFVDSTHGFSYCKFQVMDIQPYIGL